VFALRPLRSTLWLLSRSGADAVWVRLAGEVPYRTRELARSSVFHCTVAVPLVATDADRFEMTGGVSSTA
jgi:hypothetical protein